MTDVATFPARLADAPDQTCAVAAWGAARTDAEGLADFRRAQAEFLTRTLSASLLKHVEDQTFLAVVAVREALARFGDDDETFERWGVVAAPQRPGRFPMARQIERFRAEGAWTVSPHHVPQCSLHSLSGVLSQVFRVHGPNLGVGGLPGTEAQALLTAMALLDGTEMPGVWVIWTWWVAEPVPGVPAPAEARCEALALFLRPTDAGPARCYLRLAPTAVAPDGGPPPFAPAGLREALVEAEPAGGWAWTLPGFGRLHVGTAVGGEGVA